MWLVKFCKTLYTLIKVSIYVTKLTSASKFNIFLTIATNYPNNNRLDISYRINLQCLTNINIPCESVYRSMSFPKEI